MKLLSTFQSKDKQQEELARKVMRIQEVEDLASKTNANLAKAEADFNSTLARNRSKWALEEQEHAERIKDMSIEIEALENRKKQTLIPIQMYKEEADKIILEAKDIVKRSKEKEEQADFLQEKLEEKLTEVADRESILAKEEQKIEIAKQGIEVQKLNIKEGSERLSKEMFMFHEKQQSEEESLAIRKKDVSMAEISFNAKVDKHSRDLEALKIWEKRLIDERETLKRAYERIHFPL